MENKLLKTKEEYFAKLDAMLSDEDKRALLSKDDISFHFSLGLWIRNNWIYPLDGEEIKSFFKLFVEDGKSSNPLFNLHPDDQSSIVIKSYIKHLRKKA